MQILIRRHQSLSGTITTVNEAVKLYGKDGLYRIMSGKDAIFIASPHPETVDNIIEFENVIEKLRQ